MKVKFLRMSLMAICLALPFVCCACSSDEEDSPSSEKATEQSMILGRWYSEAMIFVDEQGASKTYIIDANNDAYHEEVYEDKKVIRYEWETDANGNPTNWINYGSQSYTLNNGKIKFESGVEVTYNFLENGTQLLLGFGWIQQKSGEKVYQSVLYLRGSKR